MEGTNIAALKPAIVFGRVPMFYFVVHFYMVHVLALILRMVKSEFHLLTIDFHFNKGFGGIPPNTGVTLPWVYVVWIGVVLLLYPLCKKYNLYKSTHKDWWLSYL